MKIAIFADSLPPNLDGVSRTYQNIFNYFEREGIPFIAFSPFKPPEEFSWARNVYEMPSFPFYLYPKYKIGTPDKTKIFKLLDEFKPDLVHVSSPTFLGQAGLEYSKKNNIPSLAVFHTDFASYFKYYGFAVFENVCWKFLLKFYNQFDRVLVPSRDLLKKLNKRKFKNLELWQRGIDLRLFNPAFRNDAMRKLLSPAGYPILLFVGRLVKEKDLADLVEVNRILDSDNFKYQMVFAGDGPMRSELAHQLPRARFLGYLKGKDLSQVYASSDLFIFPSTTETFGNVILEANASGLPVIGVKRGGVKNLIEYGQNGFLATPHSAREMASFVRLILKNPGLQAMMRQKAIRFASQFSLQTINEKLIGIYSELISDIPMIRAQQSEYFFKS